LADFCGIGLAVGADAVLTNEPAPTCSSDGPDFIVQKITTLGRVDDINTQSTGQKVRVNHYTVQPRRYSFLDFAKQAVPAIFAQCPQFSEVEIAFTSDLVDKRGHVEKAADISVISFTRENANTIHWDNVSTKNTRDRRLVLGTSGVGSRALIDKDTRPAPNI
jgi:hypothetical protein